MVGQIVAANPAHAVRGPRHSVAKGSTPVLSSEEARHLLRTIDVSNLVGLRDRSLIAVMTYTFARIGAAVALRVEDYYPQRKRWWLRLREKNGKVNEMPCHHNLETYLDEYLEAARIGGDKKGFLFRSAIGRTGKLSERPLTRIDAWRLVQRRAAERGIGSRLICHHKSIHQSDRFRFPSSRSSARWYVCCTVKCLNPSGRFESQVTVYGH
ncbi:MAG: tyrosine-type recombinase/integrase [Bryobacteraceae bacterium]